MDAACAEATLAGLAQTAGDLMAAIAMQVIPVFVSDNYDPDELDCFRNLLVGTAIFLRFPFWGVLWVALGQNGFEMGMSHR